MFISAQKYKKDEMVAGYSDSFVSSRHRIKRKELWRMYQMTWDGSLECYFYIPATTHAP